MRKIIIIVVGVLSLAGAGFYAFLSPTVLEWRVERACPQMTEPCWVRARALAHLWSFQGDTDRALLWYGKAAEAGDPMSMFHLAWLIEQKVLNAFTGPKAFETAGSGETPGIQPAHRAQFDIATAWYRKSAEKGFAPAMNNLGQVYAQGLSGSRSPQMAAHYYRMAAQAGNPVAGFNLSMAYEWSPAKKYNQADLQRPTLERTRFNGGMLDEALRERLRSAAAAGPPATAKLEFGQLKPVSSLPTFEQVRRQSGGPPR